MRRPRCTRRELPLVKRIHLLQRWLRFEDTVQRFLQLSVNVLRIRMEDGTATTMHRELAAGVTRSRSNSE